MRQSRQGRRALRSIGDLDLRRLLDRLVRRGFRLEVRKAGHLKLTAPDGEPYFLGKTPQDYRGLKNLEAWAKRKDPHGHR